MPCQEYLYKYKVEKVENNNCLKCVERDTIEHCLYDYVELHQPFLVLLEQWIKGSSKYKNIKISRNLFIFGVLANYENHVALNHVLLEAKKLIFYNIRNSENINANAKVELFETIIKNMIIKEKSNSFIKINLISFLLSGMPFWIYTIFMDLIL